MSVLELLHFLRPSWLMALPAIALVWWLVKQREARQQPAQEFVAPHLRDALTINPDAHRGLRPVDLAAIGGVMLTLAASGPTWQQQPSPWFAETAPLVIAIEVSDSMRANDITPTRLDRARFKLLDLIAARTGSRTAIVAYAGSAHIVVPPSSDIEVLKPLLESLDPAIMPSPGGQAATALPLARELLGDDSDIGTLLFVNDGFDPGDVEALVAFSASEGAPSMSALVVGTEEGGVALLPNGSPVTDERGARLDTRVDTTTLRRVESETGMSVVALSTDDSDTRRLLRTIDSNLQQADDPNAQWLDGGWWFLWPAALLVLVWFRRGWTTAW